MESRSINYHKVGKCKDEKERRERHLASHRRYGTKNYTCELCNVIIKQAGKARHVKSKKHLIKLEPE